MMGTMDTITPLERSALMGRVRSKDTKPELSAGRLVHRLGFRYRLHAAAKPDLFFPGRKRVIFVHEC